MQDIPNTGPGFSGYLAYWLWQVYVYFPRGDHEGWGPIAFRFFVVLLCQVQFIPMLWASIGETIQCMKDRRYDSLSWAKLEAFRSAWGVGSMFFLVWFFTTPAGLTFSDIPKWFAAPAEGPMYRSSLVLAVLTVAVLVGLTMRAMHVIDRTWTSHSTLLRQHTLTNLFAGGGILVSRYKKTGEAVALPYISMIGCVPLAAALAMACYWNWSFGAITVMNMFTLSAILFEVVRIVIVGVRHNAACR